MLRVQLKAGYNNAANFPDYRTDSKRTNLIPVTNHNCYRVNIISLISNTYVVKSNFSFKSAPMRLL